MGSNRTLYFWIGGDMKAKTPDHTSYNNLLAEKNEIKERMDEAIELIETIQGQIKGHYPKLDSIIEEFLEDDR